MRKTVPFVTLLFVVGIVAANGCSPVKTPDPIPDIAATVEAAVATALASQSTPNLATVEAAVATGVAATQTAQAKPTATPTPMPPTETPAETLTPMPTATPTFMLPSTNTATSTATPATTSKPEAVVNTELLNLRSGPGTDYDVLGVLEEGDPLKVTGRNLEGDWLRVIAPNGQEGWAARSLLVNVDMAGVPVAQAPPTPTPMYTPTPVATPTPELLPPPIPLEPENGASFIGGPVILKWQWDRPRAPDEVFSVRVYREGETKPCHHTQAQDPEYWGDLTYCHAGKHYWGVALVRDLAPWLPEDDENRWQDLSESSDKHEELQRWIYYTPGETVWTWPTPTPSGGGGGDGPCPGCRP